jgi:hypothetical protein
MSEGIGTGRVKEGWYEDPADRHDYRWFSEGAPTDLVRDGAVTSRDPISVTDPAAFESMELKQPPDIAPLLQAGSALPPDAYHVGAAFRMLDPPSKDVQGFAEQLAKRPRAGELLVVVLPLPVGLVLLALNLWIGVIVLLAMPVLGFAWLPWRMRQPARMAGANSKWRRRVLAGVAAVFVGGLGWAAYWWTASSSAPGGPGSYLLATRASLVFVQWHQPTSSGAITGTITFANLAGKPPAETVAVNSTPFTGQLSNSESVYDYYPSISLTLSYGNVGSGTFQNGKLVLYIPDEAGFGGSRYVLVRSRPAAYTTALRMLTGQKQRANETGVPHG